MSGTTWSKFFWADWQSDPALRLCSFAAKGLWMDLLCIAAAHDPIGYVAVAGRGLNETSIARMTGGLESEVRALLGELEQNGVFSRDRKGTIFSRRLLSDARRAAIAKKNGKNGGNPSLLNDGEKSCSDNQPDKPPLKPHKPLAISREDVSSLRSDTSAVASRSAPVLGPVFIALPTNRFASHDEEFSVYEPFVEEMQRLYTAIDVRDQLRAMRAWLLTHDRQRKTKSGMKRFINGWLSRSQNSAPRETIQGNGNGRGKRPTAHENFALGAYLAAGGDLDAA